MHTSDGLGVQLCEKFQQRFEEKLAHYRENQEQLNRRAFDSIDEARTGALQEQQVRKCDRTRGLQCADLYDNAIIEMALIF